MTNDSIDVSTTIDAPAAAVFAVLADPSKHAAIDGTGWVRDSLDGRDITEPGQIFRIAMYHGNHPDGHYEMSNKVTVFDPPQAIAWEPGQRVGDSGDLDFGGWIWRYDLTPVADDRTRVTLTYDWSAVPAQLREHIQFPPFPIEHLDNSLRHLAELSTA